MRSELSGVIVLNKPAGITSAKAVAGAKRILGGPKIGHTGTLDPFATGVLVCCINKATRLARFFLQGNKSYEALLRLGTATDTQDATGRTVSCQTVPALSGEEMAAIFKQFEGPQLQQPPIFSALKHNGTPLYKLARQGKPVQKAPRPVNILDLRITKISLPDVHFQVTCSAGTYVRTLCADIGQAVGCGGHLDQLHRTSSCGFAIAEALSLEALEERIRSAPLQSIVLPMADALRNMPTFQADEAVLQDVAHGRPLTLDQVPACDLQPAGTHGPLKVVDENGALQAVIQWQPGADVYNYCCVFT